MENVVDKELAELEQKIQAANDKPQPEPAKEPEPAPTPIEPVPEPTSPVTQDEFDAKQWVEKKGWKSAEDAAKSMRNLEQEFHKKNEELARLKAQPYQPPETQYQQPAYVPPPSYTPPSYQQSYQPRMSEEQIAASYNLSVEDFRKVVAINRDMYEAQNRRHQAEMNQRFEEISKQTEKNSDWATVIGDPAFHSPDVQYEMHEILSKNPTAFGERRPYSSALNQALINMGRKNATRGYSSPSVPTDPPKSFGGGSSFSGKRLPVDQKAFGAKSIEEQEKILKSMNAFKTYEDLAG